MMFPVYIHHIHFSLIGELEVNILIIPILQMGGEPQKLNCGLLEVSLTHVHFGLRARASGSFFLLAECGDERATGVDQVIQAEGLLWKVSR